MSDDSGIQIPLSVDDEAYKKGLIDAEKQAQKSGDKIKGALQTGANLGLTILGFKELFGAAKEVEEKIVGIFEKTYEWVAEGESIRQIANQFDFLSERAGIASDSLREGLKGASKGLVTETELMQSANRALVELGQDAKHLPEIMDVARKATMVFGGTINENFQQIVQSIEAGNTRALRHVGIFVDAEKAVKSYAQSLGVSANSLTQAGRQQAIMNEVLNKGQKAFEGISSSKEATLSMGRLKVAIEELSETIKVMVSERLAPMMKSITDMMSDAAKRTKSFLTEELGHGAEQSAAKLENLRTKLSDINFSLDQLKKAPHAEGDPAIMSLEQHARKTREELKKLEDEQERSMMRTMKLNQAGQSAPGVALEKSGESKGGGTNRNPIDPLKARQDSLVAIGAIQKLQEAQTDAQMQRLSSENQTSEKLEQIELLRYKKISQINDDYYVKEEALRNAQKQNRTMTADQETQTILAMEAEKTEKILTITDQMGQRMREMYKQIAAVVQNVFVGGITNGFTKLGAALAKGENGFKVLGEMVLDIIGDLCIQLGSFFVAQAVAFYAAGSSGIFPQMLMSAPATMAAGVGLITLGGFLKAVGGSGAGGGVASSSGGGGVGGSLTQSPDVGQQKPATTVTVNVQGNVLDRRETGLALVETLNEYFNTNDGRIIKVQ